MRIAFLTSTFPSLSQTFILNQVTGLLKEGHDVQIFVRDKRENPKVHPEVSKQALLSRTHYSGIPVNRGLRLINGAKLFAANTCQDPKMLPTFLSFSRYRQDALQLLYWTELFLKQEPFDIVHCHFGPYGIWGAELKELGIIKGKLVTTFYGYDISSFVQSRNPYSRLFEIGDLFIAISDHISRKLLALGCPSDRIVKLPIGVDLQKFCFSTTRLSPGEPVRILTVARLAEKKGIEYSIRAIAQVIQKHPDWEIKYRIAGDGPLRSELQDLIDHLDARHQVKLVGWMDQAEIQDLYASSHLFVLASVTAKNGDQEGQGLVLAEAQAAGLPVVCTDHNGFSESIIDHKSGFLVPERDVDSLAEKIEFLIANPQVWSDMATEGRQYIEKNYALYNLNRQLIDLYDTLLAE